MNNDLTDLQKEILNLRTKKGYSIERTIESLQITRNAFKKEENVLKEKGVYNKEDIRNAMKKRQNKERPKNVVKLSEKEETYRKKCIDILYKKYLNYNSNKKFNPVLVQKLKELHNWGSYQLIFYTIEAEAESLTYASTKPMSSEYNTISYIIAIIKNNLEKNKQRMIVQQKINKSKSDQYYNSDIVESLNKEIVSKPTNKIDMSELFED